jgi:hypothetical protein
MKKLKLISKLSKFEFFKLLIFENKILNIFLDFTVPSSRCYNASINPQVSVEFNIALRSMHYFIRDKMGLYDRSNFLVQSGIRGKFPTLTDQSTLLDNTTAYRDNKCGLTHGLLDTSWNLGGIGPQTHCSFFAKGENRTGGDLRAWDFQFGREIGEPSYASYLQAFQGVRVPCERNISRGNCPRIDKGFMDMLLQRYENKLWEMGESDGGDKCENYGS